MDLVVSLAIAALVVALVAIVAQPLFSEFLARRRSAADAAALSEEDSAWVLEKYGDPYPDLLRRLISLDHAAHEGELDGRMEGTNAQWSPVFEKSPETWALVVSRGREIVGYWSCFSLSNKLLARLKLGKLVDSAIVESEVRRLTEQGGHSLYCVMIAQDPDRSQPGGQVFKMLMTSMARSLREAKEVGAQIDAIYADATSKKGESLCRRLGLEPLTQSRQGGTIYWTGDVDRLIDRLSAIGQKRTLLGATP